MSNPIVPKIADKNRLTIPMSIFDGSDGVRLSFSLIKKNLTPDKRNSDKPKNIAITKCAKIIGIIFVTFNCLYKDNTII